MNHAFHPEAIREFEKAVTFYRERGRNLGERFAREVKKAIAKAVAHPRRWRILEDDVRRCLVNVFPYSILYTIESDYVLILAIMHGKRQPGYWRSRIKKTK